jgi:hypothetical protein
MVQTIHNLDLQIPTSLLMSQPIPQLAVVVVVAGIQMTMVTITTVITKTIITITDQELDVPIGITTAEDLIATGGTHDTVEC